MTCLTCTFEPAVATEDPQCAGHCLPETLQAHGSATPGSGGGGGGHKGEHLRPAAAVGTPYTAGQRTRNHSQALVRRPLTGRALGEPQGGIPQGGAPGALDS